MTPLPPDVVSAVAPLTRDPGSTAIVTDFDGTLAPIVDDPAGARLLDGAAEAMVRLASRFAVVAVVSGRPVAFLSEMLALPESLGESGSERPVAAVGGVRLVGLYGLEWWHGDGVVVEPGAESWRPVVSAAAGRLAAGAPDGAAEASSWAHAAVAAEVESTGLRSHPGRRSLELRPPLEVDKGSVLRRLVAGCTAACYLGDDLGDLPAYAALADLSREQGMDTLAVAVADDESAPEVVAAADLVLDGPQQALRVLEWLAGAAEGGRVG